MSSANYRNVIKHHAYYNLGNMTFLIVPNGIITICNNAFKNCTGLEYIYIPDTVCEIEEYAFMNCTKLKTIYIPSSVKKIRKQAFKNCALTEIILSPKTVIERDTFNSNVKIIRGELPSRVNLFPEVKLSQMLRLEIHDFTSTKIALSKFINDVPYICGKDTRPATRTELENGVPVYYTRKYFAYVIKDNKPLILVETPEEGSETRYVSSGIDWKNSDNVNEKQSLTISFTDTNFDKINSINIKPNTVFHVTNQGSLMGGYCEFTGETITFGGKTFSIKC